MIFLSSIDSLDALGGTTMEVDHTIEEHILVEQPSTEFDNEPLSKWIVELNSPALIDSSGMLISLFVFPSFGVSTNAT